MVSIRHIAPERGRSPLPAGSRALSRLCATTTVRLERVAATSASTWQTSWAVSFPQRFLAAAVDEWLEGAPIERDGLLRAAVETVAQPVLDRLADRAATVRGHDPYAEVSVKGLELVFDFLLGAAAHLPADPLAVRTVAERYRGPPAPRAASVVTRIAAVAGVVEVDRVVVADNADEQPGKVVSA